MIEHLSSAVEGARHCQQQANILQYILEYGCIDVVRYVSVQWTAWTGPSHAISCEEVHGSFRLSHLPTVTPLPVLQSLEYSMPWHATVSDWHHTIIMHHWTSTRCTRVLSNNIERNIDMAILQYCDIAIHTFARVSIYDVIFNTTFCASVVKCK